MFLYLKQVQVATSGNNRSEPSGSDLVLLNYSDGQLLDSSSWDGVFQTVSLFRAKETSCKDTENINTSLMRISSYIKNHPVSKKRLSGDFIPVIKSFWDLIDTIYVLK